MKASANAHDWHCEDHDTYGWRGEACPLCPKARGEAEMIEQLKADRERLLQLLESASGVIGRFVSDEGWAQSDMDMMDTIDAEIARRK